MLATLRSGSPVKVDHTPGSAVTAGDVVTVGDTVRIATRDIAANTLGSLAARGGVFGMPKAAGGSTAIAAGKKVYWDATNSVITTTSSGNKQCGWTVAASVDADTYQDVEFNPVP